MKLHCRLLTGLTLVTVVPVLAIALAGCSNEKSVSKTPCSSADLRASVFLQGATQSLVGALSVTNRSESTCTLKGSPDVTLTSPGGSRIEVSQSALAPLWSETSSPEPSGWPVVAIEPGAEARARLSLRNWCRKAGERVVLTFALPDQSGRLRVEKRIEVACVDSDSPVKLGMGPFEPVE